MSDTRMENLSDGECGEQPSRFPDDDSAPDRLDALAERLKAHAVDVADALDGVTPGEWRCWNGFKVVDSELMAMVRIGPDAGGGVMADRHGGNQRDLYATREDAEFMANAPGLMVTALDLLREAAAALLAAREERSRDAVATAALYADLLAAREEVVGYMQAMNNLGATLQRVEAERGRARGTGEYWKAEHNAANAALDAALALVAECAELVDRLRELRAPRDIEEGSPILNTCDYHALDDLKARLTGGAP
jgi:hypothetical protein